MSEKKTQESGARPESEGAGQSGSDRGTSQHASSSKREEADRQQGKTTRGRIDDEIAEGQEARESTGQGHK